MDGSVSGTAQGHDKLGRLLPGHSEYAARRRRIAARVEQLSAEYNADTPSKQILLGIVAVHLDEAERTRNSERRVRSSNAAQRILRSLPKREQPVPSLQELLANAR
jgi:hypothetical protein